MRKITMILLTLLLAVTLLPKPQPGRAAAASMTFDSTDVLDDLLSASAGGEAFDPADYPYDTDGTKRLTVLNFVEYCYSFKSNLQGAYGLYLYVYNPQAVDIDATNYGNMVQIATAYEEDGQPADYEKLPLRFCSKSGGEYANLFYKFKIADPDGRILSRINADLARQQAAGSTVEACVRRYDVSGVELVERGAANAVDYPVNTSYRFTGFAERCGADPSADSTLDCAVEELETVELEVRNTFYRTGFSNLGKDHQNQLDSVYFSVDNRILEQYGKLQKVKAMWYEYKTKPVVVTKMRDQYDKALPYIGQEIEPHNRDVHYALFHNRNYSGDTNYSTTFDWAYNPTCMDRKEISRENIDPALYYLFYTEDIESYDPLMEKVTVGGVESRELYHYIMTYDKSADRGYLPIKDGQVSADLFEDSVDENRTRGLNVQEIDEADVDVTKMLSYRDGDPDFWQRSKDFGFWKALFNALPEGLDETIEGLPPIYAVKAEDLSGTDAEVARRLCVNASDVPELRAFYTESEARSEKYPAGRQTFLFRFAVTDYFSTDLAIEREHDSILDTGLVFWFNRAYMARETVFLDFDIIQLTFNRAGVYKVIPVVASPIDIVNAITPPIDMPGDRGLPWWVWLLIVAAIVLALIMLPWLIFKFPAFFLGVVKFLWWFVKALGYTIASPVLLVVWIVKKVKARRGADV